MPNRPSPSDRFARSKVMIIFRFNVKYHHIYTRHVTAWFSNLFTEWHHFQWKTGAFCHNGYHLFQLQPPYLTYYQLLVTPDKFDTTGKSVLVYSKVAVIEAFILSELLWLNPWSLPHWVRVTHICAPINQTTVSLDNGLSPVRRQAIIWADGDLFFVEPLGIKLYIWIKIHLFFTISICKFRL